MLLRIGVPVALGDVRPEQAGSASGTLNAVQQIANAVGAALISTAYLRVASAGTAGEAVTASLVIVLVITALSLLALPLVPRQLAAAAYSRGVCPLGLLCWSPPERVPRRRARSP
jgi:hypothetical protein